MHAIASSLVLSTGLAAIASGADNVHAVRSREVALHYRVSHTSPDAEVELWYTRDHGATWRQWGIHRDHSHPLIFAAPAEGLYGFFLVVNDGGVTSSRPPEADTPPQRWIFIDYTPPLVQWDRVEPSESFASRRIVHLSWTAHDDNLPNRPVCLSYQSSVDQTWKIIDPALPNTGRYDWRVPAETNGQVALKLAVRDLGGHVVERLHGPVPLEQWLSAGIPLPSSPPNTTQTRPADPSFGQPSTRPALQLVSPNDRLRAESLCDQGKRHGERGEYALAAERFREALLIDPQMASAIYNLGATLYQQQDYSRALQMFNQVLALDGNHQLALWGAHSSYFAGRQYRQSYTMLQRLLELNANDSRARLALGDVLFMMGNRAEAREAWTRVLNTNPAAKKTLEEARNRLEQFRSANDDLTATARKRQ